jgi:ParB-like chromosome segregation protein Spo0J
MKEFALAKENPIRVDLKQISENPGPFCMSFGFDLKPLIRSVEKFGLINTPIVTKDKEGRVEVVAGYRRILALKHLQWEEVPCRDLSEAGLSSLQLLLFNLHDNLATRPFNEVEKGMILNRLIAHVPKDEILRHFMPLLDLPSHEPSLEIFLRLEELHRSMKESLVDARISFQTAKAFVDLHAESRSALFEWIANMKLNSNQQNQFIAYATDISIREEREIAQIFQEKQILELLNNKNLNIPQKAKSLLKILKCRRFPSLTRSEEAFQKTVSRLDLPAEISVHHPPFFEGPDYRLEILFRDGEQLKKKIDALGKISGLESLGDPWQEEEM